MGVEPCCILCGAGSNIRLYQKGAYSIVKCPGCDLVYALPRPSHEELRAMYTTGQDLLTFEFRSCVSGRKFHLERAHDDYFSLSRHKKGGRLLEIGCAAGFFLNYARERGWDVVGVEISPLFANFGRSEFGLEVHEDFPGRFEPASFDAVVMWGVIEHILDPLATLTECQRILKPGGVLGLVTENFSSLSRRLLGRKWFWFLPPEHLYYLTPDTAQKLLERSGLEITEVAKLYASLRTVSLSLLGDTGIRWYKRMRERRTLSNEASTNAKRSPVGILGKTAFGAARKFLNVTLPILDDRMRIFARR